MKRLAVVCLAMGVLLTVRAGYAWFNGNETNVKTGTYDNKYTSDNKYSSDNDNSIRDSRVTFDTGAKNSNNRYDNRRYDNSVRDSRSYKYDYSVKDSNNSYDSSDRSDRSIKDSYNTTTTITGNAFSDDYSTGKFSGATVSNSITGDFKQTIGHDFSGGFQGSGSTVNANITNTQTLGDFSVGASSEK